MIVRIHYTLPDGSQDTLVLSGETVADIREQADRELAARSATDPWSEVLDEGME